MFCEKCGKELINGNIIKYSEESGEPVYNKVCPSGLCEHTGLPHNKVRNKDSLLKALFNPTPWDEKCTRCGKMWVEYDYDLYC